MLSALLIALDTISILDNEFVAIVIKFLSFDRPAPPSKLYQAPDDVEMKILALAGQLSESTIEPNTHLDNTSLKYQV